MSKHDTPAPTREPCKWCGGNDFMECSVCGLEYDYRKQPMPPCGAPARIAELELIAYGGASMATDQTQPTGHLRVDVAGVAVYVRSDFERRHLEQVNHQLAAMKMALHQIVRRGNVNEANYDWLREEIVRIAREALS